MFLNKQRALGVVLVVCTIFLFMSTPFQHFASIPNEIRMFEGNSSNLRLTLPAAAQLISSNDAVVHVSQPPSDVTASTQQNESSGINVEGVKSGSAEMQLRLGNLPLKKVKVDVLPDIKVYPGGQSIGVKLNSLGVVVVGHHYIETEEGKVSPGEDAKVKIGDNILRMNGIELNNLEQIGDIVEEAGENNETLELDVLRGKEKHKLRLDPVYDEKEDKYRLGLYIRNSAAGVGTLTFYHPESGAYGALGHVISDMDTKKPIVVGDGNIVHSEVSSIERGQSGQPGEKFAHFLNDKEVLGDISKNTPFGIFGHMKERIDNGVQDEALPIALREEVQEGPAHILTVVEGQEVEKFDVEITDVVEQKFPATKGLVIKVTDPELIDKTGGIVQGMSGSPIIQNGKLVGAVTHVFINDPTSGYGCYIEWMLQDAGVNIEPQAEDDAA
ncbi:SpoIVB peptidase [Caldalkalibacillus salinus]|uniref:SpoIVB peptidase n=1 Tax=Caldalkalibacillus salinus TaxID=2803787 RepID=UPI001921554B|nr:SpoIVB peptidase [Caldalkalibacillus salinus]